MWHVSSRNGVATLRTLVTYLLTPPPPKKKNIGAVTHRFCTAGADEFSDATAAGLVTTLKCISVALNCSQYAANIAAAAVVVVVCFIYRAVLWRIMRRFVHTLRRPKGRIVFRTREGGTAQGGTCVCGAATV